MKETNFYPGIYKIIVVIVCLMLYVTIHKAHAAGNIKGQYGSNNKDKIITNP